MFHSSLSQWRLSCVCEAKDLLYSHGSENLKCEVSSFIIPGVYNALWIVVRTVDVGEGETKPLA